MPNRDELAAMFYNRLLLGIDRGAYYWSGTIASSTNAYRQRIDNGYAESSPLNNDSNTVHCVKRSRLTPLVSSQTGSRPDLLVRFAARLS